MKQDAKQHKEQTLKGLNVSWYIFNLYGLKIEDSDEWRSFLFGDATIVSHNDITSFISECREEWRKYLKFHLTDPNCSYIIVKLSNSDTVEDKYDEAEERASEVAAFLYFIYFFLSRYSKATCLGTEIFSYYPTSINFFSGKGTHGRNTRNTRKEHYTRITKKPLQAHRHNLQVIFRQNTLFKELFECVCNKNNELQKIITKSLVNFYKTSSIPHATTQLVGAITSIELLLKTEQGRYGLITDRICGLLGSKFYKSFKEKNSIFDIRHNIIHDAANCTADDAFKAFYLYSFILIAFSNLYKVFSSKEQLTAYLELIYNHENEGTKKQSYCKDPFNLLTQWEELKYDTRKFSIVMMQLNTIYPVSPLIYERKDDWEYNVALVIFIYSDLSGISIQEVISLFSEYIFPHIENPDFNFAEEIIKSEKQRLENDCEQFKEWYPSWSDEIASGLYQ